MKHSLLALALAGTLSVLSAGSAAAADVEVYGLIDLGLSYVHANPDVKNLSSKSKFSMENATEFGSRFGIKGTEDLGSGFKAGFVLENGFNADDGSLDQGGDLFGREAHLDLYTPYGAFSFGVMPVFGSTLGANGLFRAIEPLFANYTEGLGSGLTTASSWTRVDNAVSYVTPAFAGFTGYAQYAFKINGQTAGREGSANADRYAALALRYQGGALEGIIVADTTMYGSHRANSKHLDDGYTVTAGGNYTFDNGLKILAFGQWFDNMEINTKARAGVSLAGVEAMTGSYGFVDGFGLSLGAHYPVAGGTLEAQIAMRDMENQDGVDFTRWIAGAGYDYPLSKRTSVYAMAGYSVEKIEKKNGEEAKPNGCEVTIGMVHRF